MSWRQWFIGPDRDEWSEHARESILDANDGIVSAASVAEGFASAGAPTRTLLLAGAVLILAGGLAAAAARYAEQYTEWEMNRRLIEAERASIQADPESELEELIGIYEAKGLPPGLARQVAEALTEHDPVAAHADAELRLDVVGSKASSRYAAVVAGLSYALGAVLPLAVITAVPAGQRIALTFAAVLVALALTGWFAARLTGLPPLRLVRRNLLVGAVIMAAGVLVGSLVGL